MALKPSSPYDALLSALCAPNGSAHTCARLRLRVATTVGVRVFWRWVARRNTEEEFWRNYFSHVFAVKRRFELGVAADGAASAELAAVCAATATPCSSVLDDAMTPSTPASPARLSLTVSYPEKFHLAVKYAAEGPPLPNLSDADRILLDALQQQATVGECNRPRPGMWDSAEEKAKYEAWKKLGSMSRAEAMHLYVQVRPVPPTHPRTLQAAHPRALSRVPARGNARQR